MSRIRTGEYVLATKYSGGDPGDHWYVGFMHARLTRYVPIRYDVVDERGASARGNGFRRVERITCDVGAWLLRQAPEIDMSSKSLWWWKRQAIAATKRESE